MRTHNSTASLWSRSFSTCADFPAFSGSSAQGDDATDFNATDLQAVAIKAIDPDFPICCWNLCGSRSGVKQPRIPAERENGRSSGPSKPLPTQYSLQHLGPPAQPDSLLPTPIPSITTGAYHVTRRLLIEPVGQGRHLVFNPLSGAVDEIGDKELAQLEALQRGDRSSLTSTEENILRQRRYLYDTLEAEEADLEQSVASAWARMQTAQPEMYTVCPTLACNLACAYCFEGDSLLEKPQGVMSEAQVGHLFSAIATLRAGLLERGQSSEAAPWISLFGGEPLLPSTKRCVRSILKHAADGGFLVGATTNGVNLVHYEDLLREYADILTVFQVTLDGPRALHDSRRHRLGGQGTFDEIVRGIDLLLFLGIDVDLRMNVDMTNLPALPELVAFLDERGWTSHPGFQLLLAPVTEHDPVAKGCGSKTAQVLTEMEMAQGVMALIQKHPRVGDVCHLGFLRHLDYLVSVLEPIKHRQGRGSVSSGPRYWYCEASTDKQFVFTPDGLIYSCTEAVGKPQHAIGRFDPNQELWRAETQQWLGRTILSHPQCRTCAISTLCGGGCNFAAREQATSGETLLQVSIMKQRNAQPLATHRHTQTTEPFCNAAEETVRAYLRYIGAQRKHNLAI